MKAKLRYIDYECKIGERVRWENLKGDKFEGIIIKWDSDIATIKLDDGSEKLIEC